MLISLEVDIYVDLPRWNFRVQTEILTYASAELPPQNLGEAASVELLPTLASRPWWSSVARKSIGRCEHTTQALSLLFLGFPVLMDYLLMNNLSSSRNGS